MKAKITKKDGTVIELEGTAAELTPIIEREPPPKITVTGPTPGDIIGKTDSGLGKLLDEMTKRQREHDQLPYQQPWTVPQQPWTVQPWPHITYNDMCPMGGPHDYPLMWMSISPPPCSKCGKSSGPRPNTTFTLGTVCSSLADMSNPNVVLGSVRFVESQS